MHLRRDIDPTRLLMRLPWSWRNAAASIASTRLDSGREHPREHAGELPVRKLHHPLKPSVQISSKCYGIHSCEHRNQ
jgi:hypothetical protein